MSLLTLRCFAVALALLLCGPASAAWTGATDAWPANASVYEVQGTTSPATRAAPTVAGDGATAGLNAAQAQGSASRNGTPGLSVVVCSATGTTLSGAGSIVFYSYDPATPEWAPASGLGTLSVTATTRCQSFLLSLPNVRGRLMAAASGVTFSAGSAGVTVYMLVR
jgi:hypothetical protein